MLKIKSFSYLSSVYLIVLLCIISINKNFHVESVATVSWFFAGNAVSSTDTISAKKGTTLKATCLATGASDQDPNANLVSPPLMIITALAANSAAPTISSTSLSFTTITTGADTSIDAITVTAALGTRVYDNLQSFSSNYDNFLAVRSSIRTTRVFIEFFMYKIRSSQTDLDYYCLFFDKSGDVSATTIGLTQSNPLRLRKKGGLTSAASSSTKLPNKFMEYGMVLFGSAHLLF
jgi:hypothetical protein